MITKYIYGNTFDEEKGFRYIRRTARAFIRNQANEILMMHAEVDDMYMLPGGGIEAGETPMDCVIRECQEEAGLIIKPFSEHALRVREYYKDRMYEVNYFYSQIEGETTKALTGYEVAQRMTPVWESEEMCKQLLEERFSDINERRAGLAMREYTALTHFLEEGV